MANGACGAAGAATFRPRPSHRPAERPDPVGKQERADRRTGWGSDDGALFGGSGGMIRKAKEGRRTQRWAFKFRLVF